MPVTLDQIGTAALAYERQRLLVLRLERLFGDGKRGDPFEEAGVRDGLERTTRALIATFEIENA